MSRGKKVLFAAVPTVVLALLALAGAEIGLRLRYEKIERLTGVTDWQEGTALGLTYFWDQYHPSYGWTNTPGYRSDDRVPFRVAINGQGLRGTKEHASRPPPGTRRIAVLGDSCTFGEEVDDDQTLPHYLERYLANAEVLNFGVHGFGLGQMALRLEEEVFTFHPDDVLLVLTLPSDLGRIVDAEFVHAKPVFSVRDGRLAIDNHPVPLASLQPWLYRHCFTAAWLFARPEPIDDVDSWDEVLEIARLLLERIERRCDEQGVRLTVVSIAGPSWVGGQQSHREAAALIGTGLRLLSRLKTEQSPQIGFLQGVLGREADVVAPTTAHWAARGNCLLAGNVARDLVRKDPQWSLAPNPPECTSAPGAR